MEPPQKRMKMPNMEQKEVLSRSKPKGILLHIELAPSFEGFPQKWLHGKVATWKVIYEGGKSSERVRVRYTNRKLKFKREVDKVVCDTRELEEVLETIRVDTSDPKRPKWVKIPSKYKEPFQYDSKLQRFFLRAFLEGFPNASGRNFIDALFTKYVKIKGNKQADIWNIGGESKCSIMQTIYMMFSPLKMNLRPKAMKVEEASSIDSDSDSDLEKHNPTPDNVVYDPENNMAILIGSAKCGSNFRTQDIEQLYHEMLSCLPLDGSNGNVGGLIINQSQAQFHIAMKDSNTIEIANTEGFDFETPPVSPTLHRFVQYLISFIDYCE